MRCAKGIHVTSPRIFFFFLCARTRTWRLIFARTVSVPPSFWETKVIFTMCRVVVSFARENLNGSLPGFVATTVDVIEVLHNTQKKRK